MAKIAETAYDLYEGEGGRLSPRDLYEGEGGRLSPRDLDKALRGSVLDGYGPAMTVTWEAECTDTSGMDITAYGYAVLDPEAAREVEEKEERGEEPVLPFSQPQKIRVALFLEDEYAVLTVNSMKLVRDEEGLVVLKYYEGVDLFQKFTDEKGLLDGDDVY